MRARAPAVKCSAQTFIFGTTSRRESSVMGPTTAVLSVLPSMNLFSLERDRGGLLMRVPISLCLITLLNLASVRRAKKLVQLDEEKHVRVLSGGRLAPGA